MIEYSQQQRDLARKTREAWLLMPDSSLGRAILAECEKVLGPLRTEEKKDAR